MSEFLQNFHFLRPWMLFFLMIPLLLFLKKLKSGKYTSSWADICDKNLLNYLLVRTKFSGKTYIKELVYTGLIVAALSAAGPVWKKKEVPALTAENPVMFVLSLAQDMQLKDISPSRLERAKFAISDLSDYIPQGQFGLEVYSGEPYIITPLSDDIKLLKNLLPQIKADIVPDGEDRLDRAINQALSRFQSAGYAGGTIVVLAADTGQRFDLALKSAENAAKLNYKLHIIDSSFSGNEKLKILADTGKGEYLSIQTADMRKLSAEIKKMNDERIKISENMRSQYDDYGYYLLIIPAFCLLFFFRRGLLILFLCLFSFSANASFFFNENQDGYRFFQKGLYEQATQTFKDPVWKGVSLYKQEKAEDALKEFQKIKSSISLYNQGVILTKLCKYQEAKDAFSAALEVDSANTDAQYNLNVLNDLFEKAKEKPEILNCGENQQQQQSAENNKDNSNANQSQNEQQSSAQKNNKQNNQDESKQKNAENSQNEENSSDETQSSEQKENQQKNNTGQEKGENNKKSEQGKETQQQSSAEQNSEDNGTETQNKQETGSDGESSASSPKDSAETDTSGSEQQNKEQTVSLINAQEGRHDDEYDGEAALMRRQYREIPEDTGGLLREFIRKEYRKDRYKNEKI